MNRKVKSFKQCFYRNSVQCRKLQQVLEEQSFGLDTGPQLFIHSFILDNTLFSPEIHCLGVSSHYCCYGNHAAGYEPIKKLFIVSIENWIRSLSLPEIIGKSCELVKLSHIIRSGPVLFWDTVYMNIISVA